MALLKFKPTVVVPKVTIIAAAVINAANAMGLEKDMTVTSGNDSDHMIGSKHYSDEALDFRTKHLSKEQVTLLAAGVRSRLGPKYQAIVESDHLHVEYDPS